MLSEMNAAVLYGKEDVRIERVPIPAAGKGEIVIRVHAALTCGTDLKVFRRGYHARMIAPPALFGHEMAGVVHEVGQGVRSFKPGMRVVALNSAPCGVCYWCVRTKENLCGARSGGDWRAARRQCGCDWRGPHWPDVHARSPAFRDGSDCRGEAR